MEVASGTESQAPGPSVEAPGNSPAKFPGPPAEAPGDPKETAPRPSRHITIGIFSDATASLASHVNRLKSVAKAIFAIVQGMKAAGDDGLVVHIVMAAMRDWCVAAHVFRVYTEEKASIRAGAILPMAYTGAAGQDEHLLRTLDAMASDCQGWASSPPLATPRLLSPSSIAALTAAAPSLAKATRPRPTIHLCLRRRRRAGGVRRRHRRDERPHAFAARAAGRPPAVRHLLINGYVLAHQ